MHLVELTLFLYQSQQINSRASKELSSRLNQDLQISQLECSQ